MVTSPIPQRTLRLAGLDRTFPPNVNPIEIMDEDGVTVLFSVDPDGNISGGLTTLAQWIESKQGGDTTKMLDMEALPLAGPKAWRQGAIYILMDRTASEPITGAWDGNGDTGLKIQVYNYADNGPSVLGDRAVDLQARNRSTGVSAWVYTAELNARNDGVTDAINPLHVRAENYGTVNTSILGIDIEMSSENDTSSPDKYALRIRNTDQSGMTAVAAAIDIRHTSTNGFANLFNFAAATGDTVSVGSLNDSSAGDIKCTDYITVSYNGSPRYIPLYAATH